MPSLPVYNKCNNNCIMCSNPNDYFKMKGGFGLSYLLKRIEQFRKGENTFIDNYRDSFSLTGGEPTLSPHLVNTIKKIDNCFPGIRIICLTNGRKFAYKNYCRKILQLDINLELIISIHGHNSETHDKITQVDGSFYQTIKGLENTLRFRKPSHIVEVRIVIHRLNYKSLVKTVRFLRQKFPLINRLVFIFFEIEGRAADNIKALNLTYTQLFPYLKKICKLISSFREVRFYHFPLCALSPELFPYVWRTLPDYEVDFPRSCKSCKLKKYCLGVHKGYLKFIGRSEFQPIRSNFNIVESSSWYNPIHNIGS